MRPEEIAIIGAGPAGISAAIQCKRLGINPLLFDRTGEPGGLIKNAFLIENYPGLEEPISGPEFVELLERNIENYDIPVKKMEVISISKRDYIYSISCKEDSIESEVVIVATGTEHKQVGISLDEDALRGFIYYEVTTLLDEHKIPGKVLIIGSGEAACDYALTLASMGADVNIYARGEKLKIRGKLAKYIAENASINISYGTNCHGISITDRDKITVTTCSINKQYCKNEFNAVLIAVGRFSTARSLLDDSLLMTEPEITFDEPGLFIAGDARNGSLGQLGIAVGDGIMAATKAVNYLENK